MPRSRPIRGSRNPSRARACARVESEPCHAPGWIPRAGPAATFLLPQSVIPDMLRNEALTIITVIIFIAPVAIFVPAFMGATQADMSSNNMIIELNETNEVGQNIEIEALDINSSEAEIGIYDSSNGEYDSQTISEGENATYAFENGDVIVELKTIQSPERLGVFVEYPSEFGWNEQETQVNDTTPAIVVLPIAVIILSVLFAVIKEGGD